MGIKKEYFFLQLSFIGWLILDVFTLGILSLWLVPYMEETYACYYNGLLKINNMDTQNPNNNINQNSQINIPTTLDNIQNSIPTTPSNMNTQNSTTVSQNEPNITITQNSNIQN